MMRPAPTIAAAWIAFSPMPPQPITATISPGPHLGGVQHRADAGRDAAADERGLVERHVGPDLHEHVLVHEQLLGEARQVGELEERLIAAPQPRRAGGIGGEPDLVAQVRPTRQAVAARAAEAADARDHVIAGLHVRDLRAHRLDDAGRLVTEHGRHRVRVLALHEVEIGVAQARPRRSAPALRADRRVPICTSSMTSSPGMCSRTAAFIAATLTSRDRSLHPPGVAP